MEIALPPLEDLASVAPPLPPVPPRPGTDGAPPSEFNVLPWALMGGGAVLVASSLIPGLMANGKAGELKDACPTKVDCDPALKSKRDSADTLALVSDVLWIAGALTAGVGVTLFVIDQQSEAESAQALDMSLRAGCFGAGCGLSAQGRF
jgi:hypothetical protein